MMDIPECFYRVSVKALILNEDRDKFLICKEENGKWELPGGGLEWGASPQKEIAREIKEEMALDVTWIAEQPSYFNTSAFELRSHGGGQAAGIIYETEVRNLDFTPSDECVEIAFVNKETVGERKLFSVVLQLLDAFDPVRHQVQNK